MEQNEIVEIIRRELPGAMDRSPELTDFILNLTEGRYARRAETNDRFYELLGELRRDREEQKKLWKQHWEEQAIYRAQQDEKWKQERKEDAIYRAKQDAKWQQHVREQELHLQALEKKWAEERIEQEKRWDEQREKWKEEEQHRVENQKQHEVLAANTKRLGEEMRQTLGAMGARWGTRSEKSFRNALKGILEEHFPIRVLNVTEFDEDGVVFGRPATIELDLIIKDGLLIICEIKSSVSLGDAFVFSKKVAFYEERHNKKADKLIMISPMVDKKARDFAKETGITIYTFAHEIEPEIA